MKPDKNLLWPISILFLLGLVLGCSSNKEKEDKHYSSALQYIEKNELKKAVIELKNVVQLNPKNDVAYYELGETYLKLKQGKEAFESYSAAASINPANLDAQLKTGQILLLGSRTDEARKKAELILEKSPENTKALVLLSGVQAQESDIDAALTTMQRCAALEPENSNVHLSLGRLLMLKQDLAAAEAEYDKAKKLDPVSPEPYISLSRIYASQGNWEKAESELKKMNEISGPDYRNLFVMGRFYEIQKKWDQAEKIYIQAVDSAPEEDVLPLIQLGNFYRERKSFDQALKAMNKALEKKKDDPNIQVGIAQIYLEANQIPKADEILDKVLAKDKGHLEATFLKGRIYLSREDFDHALPLFDLVVRETPRNAMGYYFMAICNMGKGDTASAKENLLKAVELNPQLREARLILAEFFLRERSNEPARQHINAVLEQEPNNASALMLLGILRTMEQDLPGAEVALKEVIAQNPNYAPAYFRLGVVYNLMGRQEDGLNSLQKALDLDPKFLDALTLTVDIYIKGKNYEKAGRVCEDIKESLKESPPHLAAIEYLEGNIAMERGDPQEAQQHFENAIKMDPNLLSAYVASATSYIEEKNIPGAISQYEALLQKNPKSLAAYMGLGIIYEQQGDGAKAEANYRKALEIKNDFAPAANNLAWNLMERGGNIDEALGFAQIAKEQMPKNASVMDTLGWIYYLKGSYLNALNELQDGIILEPDNPVINYHLGMAHYKNGQLEEAKPFLEKALRLNPEFKGAQEANTVLEEIKVSKKGD